MTNGGVIKRGRILFLQNDDPRVCTRCQGIQGKTRPLPPQANPLPCQVSPVKSPALFYTFFNGSISLDDLYLTPLACKTINLTA